MGIVTIIINSSIGREEDHKYHKMAAYNSDSVRLLMESFMKVAVKSFQS